MGQKSSKPKEDELQNINEKIRQDKLEQELKRLAEINGNKQQIDLQKEIPDVAFGQGIGTGLEEVHEVDELDTENDPDDEKPESIDSDLINDYEIPAAITNSVISPLDQEFESVMTNEHIKLMEDMDNYELVIDRSIVKNLSIYTDEETREVAE